MNTERRSPKTTAATATDMRAACVLLLLLLLVLALSGMWASFAGAPGSRDTIDDARLPTAPAAAASPTVPGGAAAAQPAPQREAATPDPGEPPAADLLLQFAQVHGDEVIYADYRFTRLARTSAIAHLAHERAQRLERDHPGTFARVFSADVDTQGQPLLAFLRFSGWKVLDVPVVPWSPNASPSAVLVTPGGIDQTGTVTLRWAAGPPQPLPLLLATEPTSRAGPKPIGGPGGEFAPNAEIPLRPDVTRLPLGDWQVAPRDLCLQRELRLEPGFVSLREATRDVTVTATFARPCGLVRVEAFGPDGEASPILLRAKEGTRLVNSFRNVPGGREVWLPLGVALDWSGGDDPHGLTAASDELAVQTGHIVLRLSRAR